MKSKRVKVQVKVKSDADMENKKDKAGVNIVMPAVVTPKDKDGNPAIPPITE